MKNQLTQTQISEVLTMFCDPEHPEEYAHKPRKQGPFIWATDGHGMVWINVQHVKHELETIDKPLFNNVLPHYTGQKPIIIKVQKMINFLKRNAWLVDEYIVKDEKCPTCNGVGKVASGDGDDLDDLCCECDGDRTIEIDHPTGRKIANPDTMFFDGFGLFSYRQMMRILIAAEVLGLEEIEQKQGAPHDPYAYEMGEFKALMMPMAYDDEALKSAIHFTHNSQCVKLT